MVRVEYYIDVGFFEGVCLVIGGNWIFIDSGGFFVELMVFVDVDNGMMIVCEEIFGLVFSIIFFVDEEDVVWIVNDILYGFLVVVWIFDLVRVYWMVWVIRVGMIWINLFD